MQWKYDVEGANKLLDSIGAAKGPDGIRVLNGARLGPWDLECPFGWTDWNAALEIVMQSALKIGIDLRTKFPESPVWMNDRNTGNFDILMHTPVSVVSPSQPWNRANFILNSKGVPAVGETAFSNFGRFKDARADEILDQIPRTKDAAQLKKLYTELTIIWLKNIPTVPLMYRPSMFYTFNESVWTGFPVEGDGTNIPPNILTDGAGIKGLYVIKNK
jgi:peptide/nickel transport system substrate-binding protein